MINVLTSLKSFQGRDINIYLSGIYISGSPETIHECEIVEEDGKLLFLGNEEDEEVKFYEKDIQSIDTEKDTYINGQAIIHLIGGLNLMLVA